MSQKSGLHGISCTRFPSHTGARPSVCVRVTAADVAGQHSLTFASLTPHCGPWSPCSAPRGGFVSMPCKTTAKLDRHGY